MFSRNIVRLAHLHRIVLGLKTMQQHKLKSLLPSYFKRTFCIARNSYLLMFLSSSSVALHIVRRSLRELLCCLKTRVMMKIKDHSSASNLLSTQTPQLRLLRWVTALTYLLCFSRQTEKQSRLQTASKQFIHCRESENFVVACKMRLLHHFIFYSSDNCCSLSVILPLREIGGGCGS